MSKLFDEKKPAIESLASTSKLASESGPSLSEEPKKFKTCLCVYHKFGTCTRGEKCTYAHSEAELLKGPQCPPGRFRSRECVYFKVGFCPQGSQCSFQHGPSDTPVCPPASSKGGKSKKGKGGKGKGRAGKQSNEPQLPFSPGMPYPEWSMDAPLPMPPMGFMPPMLPPPFLFPGFLPPPVAGMESQMKWTDEEGPTVDWNSGKVELPL